MKLFFGLILVSMIAVTTWASMEHSVIDGFRELFSSRWGIATLGDTYFSFLLIYLWIAHRERSLAARVVWLILVCSFGTIAISGYGLLQIKKGKSLL
jgi:hypothetical protein